MGDVHRREDHIGRAVQAAHDVFRLFLERMSAAIQELTLQHEIDSARELVHVSSSGDKEATDRFLRAITQEASMLCDDFPRHLYTSVIIAWFSCLESQLNRICKREQRLRGLTRSPEDLRGRGIGRSFKYLTLVVGLSPSTLLYDLWWEIDGFRRIRNLLVHREGRFELVVDEGRLTVDVKDDINSYLERHKDVLTIDPFGFVELTHGYCELVLSHGVTFMKQLLYELGRTESPDSFRVRL